MDNRSRFHLLRVVCACAPILSVGGCTVVSTSQLGTLRTENRVLADQNRAQLTEIENLKSHCREVEDQLIRREEDIALLENQLERNRRQIANFQREREELEASVLAALRRDDGRTAPLSEETRTRLQSLSERSGYLQFPPDSAITKLETDILFDSGSEDLAPDAARLLRELAAELNRREAKPLRVVIVGHTDAESISKKPVREQFKSNFHLSAARSLAVADALREFGVSPERIAVSGYGPFQPVAPNISPVDRRKNRRVEIFVMAPEVPLVGCVETMPALY